MAAAITTVLIIKVPTYDDSGWSGSGFIAEDAENLTCILVQISGKIKKFVDVLYTNCIQKVSGPDYHIALNFTK